MIDTMIYVWRDFTQLDNQDINVEQTKSALRAWVGVADSVIAMCSPGKVLRWRNRLREWGILPAVMGIKTFSLWNDFSTKAFWDQVLEFHNRLKVLSTDSPILVLDHETKLKIYHTAGPQIALRGVTKALGELADVKLWHYCCDVLANTPKLPKREQWTYDLTETMASVNPAGRFIHGYWARPAKRDDSDHQRRYGRMIEAVRISKSLVPGYLVRTNATDCWSPATWFARFGKDLTDCVIHPGVENFEACGLAMRKAIESWNAVMAPIVSPE